jgi:hypothetical protein
MIPTKTLVTALAILVTIATSSAAPAFGRGSLTSVFAIPRGGGLFGGKDKESTGVEAKA